MLYDAGVGWAHVAQGPRPVDTILRLDKGNHFPQLVGGAISPPPPPTNLKLKVFLFCFVSVTGLIWAAVLI